jgi:pimeloyl-ACP methyl ester carboxylesterase
MRSVLRALGHNVSGWSLGANRGPTVHVVQELRQQVERLHRNSGRRVSLVGWSLGGLYAQELARASPGSVRGLVTLASPVTRWPQWMRTASGVADHGTRVPRALASLPRPWAERGSHLGTGHNPAVLWLLADRLGMAEGAWTPFRPPLGLRPFFPRR